MFKKVKFGTKTNRKGFTLVELLVVLVILAILSTLLVPALTGYIDKAKEKKIIAEARGLYTAAQTAISEHYALADTMSHNARWRDPETGVYVNVRKISNNMLARIQGYNDDRFKAFVNNSDNASSLFDAYVSVDVLKYLNSYREDPLTYTFKSGRYDGTTQNPCNTNVKVYEDTYNQPGVLIVYQNTGKVLFVEFGRDNVLVHIDNKGNITATTGGTFANVI